MDRSCCEYFCNDYILILLWWLINQSNDWRQWNDWMIGRKHWFHFIDFKANYVCSCNMINIHHDTMDTWYTFLHPYISESVKMRRNIHENEKSLSQETCQIGNHQGLINGLSTYLPFIMGKVSLFYHFFICSFCGLPPMYPVVYIPAKGQSQ